MARLIAEQLYGQQTEARKLFAPDMHSDDDLGSILIDRKNLFRLVGSSTNGYRSVVEREDLVGLDLVKQGGFHFQKLGIVVHVIGLVFPFGHVIGVVVSIRVIEIPASLCTRDSFEGEIVAMRKLFPFLRFWAKQSIRSKANEMMQQHV